MRKQLRADILNTKRQKEEQLNANDVAVRQIERLKMSLTDIKCDNQDKRVVSRLLDKSSRGRSIPFHFHLRTPP